MEPLTQPSNSYDDPVVATQAKNFTKAIFQHESGNNYTASGDAGTSHGAGQWQPATWKEQAKDVLGDENAPQTPENQSVVAQGTFRKWFTSKDKGGLGLDAAQAAAKWNSGSPSGWENKVGTTVINGQQIKYNVPKYVKDVTDLYQQYKSQTPQSQNIAQNTNGVTPTANASGSEQPQQSFGEKALGVAGKVGDFFFPIVKDAYHDVTGQNDKTALQQAGDLGLSALSVIPGLGEIGGAVRGAGLAAKGLEAANFASKTARVGSEISNATKAAEAVAPIASKAAPGLFKRAGTAAIKGAGVGYGADVASNLSQGKTDVGKILAPGLGTVTGGVLGAGGVGLASTGDSMAARMVNSLIKPLKKNFAYGKNPGRAVAEEGIVGNTLDDLANNIGSRRQDIGNQIGAIGDEVSKTKGVTLSLSPALSPIDKALQKAAQTNNQAVFGRLQQVKRAITEDLTSGMDENGLLSITSKGARPLEGINYNEGQKLKKMIGDMTAWTGNPTDDKTVNAALQGVWKGISEAQKKAAGKLSPTLRSKLEALNQRYGDLTEAEIATKYREAIHGRQNLISLGDKLSGGVGLLGGLVAGGPVGATLGGAAMTGLSHAAGSTAVKSRVASYLAKAAGKRSVLKAAKNPTTVGGFLTSAAKTAAIRAAANQ